MTYVKNLYRFREIQKDEIPVMFAMIAQRIRWMDEQGIHQWNETDYETVYPLSYYEGHRQRGEVFVLEEIATGQIVCAAVLKEEDDRWPDDEDAVFVHNLVAPLDKKGVGRLFLHYAEDYARQKGKPFFRLDSAIDNLPLTRYYEQLGFEAVGTCVDGLYIGTLRQKKL